MLFKFTTNCVPKGWFQMDSRKMKNPCFMLKIKKRINGASTEDAQNYDFLYSKPYFSVDAKLRPNEFRMSQLPREEALDVWKK